MVVNPGSGQLTLTWGAASDNVGVSGYNVHRSTSAGFTPSAANRIAQPSDTTHTDTGLAAGVYYYRVTAQDAEGNIGPASNEASATVADTTPPSAPGTLTATGGRSKSILVLEPRERQPRRRQVQRPSIDYLGLHAVASNRIGQPTGI